MSSVGLVHDYLLVMRGAERTFTEIAACWPDAPLYALLQDPKVTAPAFAGREIHTSRLQRLPLRQAGFRVMLPLFPAAAERLPIGEHDVIVSSSSAFAHGVRPAPHATHVTYCHSPFRYAWHERARALEEAPRPLRPLLARMLRNIRAWDLEASHRVSHYVANSELTRERIQQIYSRDAEVVHPPVDTGRFSTGEPGDSFLVVGELVGHKRVHVAIEAARSAGRRLQVIGSGPDRHRLEQLYAGPRVEFLGRVSDAELSRRYASCLALIVPNIEEFGIAAVEAQAAGRPVVAIDAGGVRETVVPGRTGVLVPPGESSALAEALRDVDFTRFDPQVIREHAQSFSAENFRRNLKAAVARQLS